MRRRSSRRSSTRRNTQGTKPFAFLRRPIVQLSIIMIAVILIFVIALTAKK
jgi:hypothetical protein